jgi:4-amino-4-deoxy-L-arabinose transferase-like glycosyltransferase
MVPSLLAGLAVIPAVYLLARRIGGTGAGLVAALLVAVAPSFLVYSNELRPYMLLMLLLVVSTLALLEAASGKGRWWWVLYAAAGSLALWTHYTAAFVLGPQALVALLLFTKQRRGILLANLATGLAFTPWLPFVEEKASMSWYPEPRLANSIVLFRTFPGEQFMPSTPDAAIGFFKGQFLLLYLFWLLGALLLWAAFRSTRAGARPNKDLLLIAAAGAGMPLGVAVNSLVSNYGMFTPRHIFAFAAYAAVLLGWATVKAEGKLRTGLVLPMALILGLGVALHFTDAADKPPYWEAAQLVGQKVERGDLVLDALPGLGRRFATPYRLQSSYGTVVKVEKFEPVHVITTGYSKGDVWLIASPRLNRAALAALKSLRKHDYRVRQRWVFTGVARVIVLKLARPR